MKIIAVIFLLFINSSLFAQEVKPSLLEEVKSDLLSPLHNSDAQKVLIVGGTTTLFMALFKTTYIKSFQRDIHEDQFLCCNLTKPGNTFVQFVPNLLYSIGFGLNYYFSHEDNDKRRAIGMAKASLYSGLITDILKPVINEQRPNGGNHSFPSGHTTTAFAFASYVASEHPWYIGVPAYVMASYVGFCRMQDNFHFLHDVVAGATLGISYGIAISQNSRSEQKTNSAIVVVPTEDLKGMGLKYALHF
jgi:membrane-associated phospholipid phosphatase